MNKETTAVLMMVSEFEYPEIIIRAVESATKFVSQVVLAVNGETRFKTFVDKTTIVVDNGPWQDFGRNRTKAMCQALDVTDKEWIITLDADDELIATDVEHVYLLPGVYLVKSVYGDIEYHTPMLFHAQTLRDTPGWEWQGKIHEYWSGIQPRWTELPFYQLRHNDSERSKTGRVDQAELELLKQDYEAGSKRGRFYYGRTLKETGDKSCIAPLTEHVNDPDAWIEERYVAAMDLYEATGQHEWVKTAGELVPGRPEWLIQTIKHSVYKYIRDLRTEGLFMQKDGLTRIQEVFELLEKWKN